MIYCLKVHSNHSKNVLRILDFDGVIAVDTPASLRILQFARKFRTHNTLFAMINAVRTAFMLKQIYVRPSDVIVTSRLWEEHTSVRNFLCEHKMMPAGLYFRKSLNMNEQDYKSERILALAQKHQGPVEYLEDKLEVATFVKTLFDNYGYITELIEIKDKSV